MTNFNIGTHSFVLKFLFINLYGSTDEVSISPSVLVALCTLLKGGTEFHVKLGCFFI